MKQNLIIIFILIFNYSNACECPTVDKKTLMENSEYVFIGTVIENVHFNESMKNYFDQKRYGTEVKIKVDSILKGVVNSEYVIINQIDSGNCTRQFEFGKQYVISGIQIKGYINHVSPIINSNKIDLEESKDSVIDIPITQRIEEPLRLGLRDGYVQINDGLELVKYWNEIAKEYLIIQTDVCVSGYVDSEFGKRIIKTD